MIIRHYLPGDCRELADLFYNTVHTINAKDYTREQLDAWASGQVDLSKWNQTFLEHYTLVAIENGMIVGFGDIDSTGYLDHLFVHKDWARVWGLPFAAGWSRQLLVKCLLSLLLQLKVFLLIEAMRLLRNNRWRDWVFGLAILLWKKNCYNFLL